MMRRAGWSGVFTALAIWGNPVLAEEIAWLRDTEAAWRQTVSEGRPLLVFVTRANCKYCKQMKNVTFADEQVRGLVRGDFVSLEVNPSRDAQLVKELKITSYPTTLVISPESELLDQIKGYLPPEEFQQRLDRCRAQATAAPPRSSRR